MSSTNLGRVELDRHWTWNWTINQAASFGDHLYADIVRVFVIVAGSITVMCILRVLKEERRRSSRMPPGQRSRFYALALAVLSLAATEASVFGTTATPRLPVTILILALSFHGIRTIRRKQHSIPLKE
jgi:hypothetical protein